MASVPDLVALRRKYGVYPASELRECCKKLHKDGYIIEGLIPGRSISMFVGDSGIGKSPLLYQAAMCVASGTPFLGLNVGAPKRVLYIDYENGPADIDRLVSSLGRHLDIEIPEYLLTQSIFNLPQNIFDLRAHLAAIVGEAQAEWVIIDSMSAYNPEMETKADIAQKAFKDFRSITRQAGAAFTLVHHPRKPEKKPDLFVQSLAEAGPRAWFDQARGTSVLKTGSDARVCIEANKTGLLVWGFTRLQGPGQQLYVGRCLDDDDQPRGYARLSGAGLLDREEQRKAYDSFPSRFRHTEAKHIYGKSAQAITDFLNKCISVGILKKDPVDGYYEKVRTADQAD